MTSSRFIRLTDALSARLSRRTALTGVSAAALASQARVGAQTGTPAADSATQVGIAPPGTNAFEFVGVVQQLGLDFSLTAYVTNLAGVDSALLFEEADPLARSEANARLLLSGTGTGTARSILDNLFVVNAEGAVTFSIGGPGASFADAASFEAGTPIASMSVSLQDVINVQALQQGLATGYGTFIIDSTNAFDLGGASTVLAAPGTRYRLSFTGQGTLQDPATLNAFILIAGNCVVAG